MTNYLFLGIRIAIVVAVLGYSQSASEVSAHVHATEPIPGCFVLDNADQSCVSSRPVDNTTNGPSSFDEYGDCHCEGGRPVFDTCLTKRTTWAKVQDTVTLEWYYHAAVIEENFLANIHDCSLCTPAHVVTNCTDIRSDRVNQDDLTVSDCERGLVFERGMDGIDRECSFVESSDPDDPNAPFLCQSAHREDHSFPGSREIANATQCCEDADNDGAGDGFCGSGNNQGNGHQDCNANEPGVQRGCGLEIMDVRVDFSDKYIEQLRRLGIDIDEFNSSQETIGEAEVCDGSKGNDANADGYPIDRSYQCGYTDADPDVVDHDRRFEFPLRSIKVATEQSEIECIVSVNAHYWGDGDQGVPLTNQRLVVDWEQRFPTSANFRRIDSTAISLDGTHCTYQSGSTFECRVPYRITEKSRGRHLTCHVTPQVGEDSAYWDTKAKWAQGVVAAKRAVMLFPSEPVFKAGKVTVKLDGDCHTALYNELGGNAPNEANLFLAYETRLQSATGERYRGRTSANARAQGRSLLETGEFLLAPHLAAKVISYSSMPNPWGSILRILGRQRLNLGPTEVTPGTCTTVVESSNRATITLKQPKITWGTESLDVSSSIALSRLVAQELADVIGLKFSGDARADLFVFDTFDGDELLSPQISGQAITPNFGVMIPVKVEGPVHVDLNVAGTSFSNYRSLILYSNNTVGRLVLAHEAGHAIGGLCDEYNALTYAAQDSASGCPNEFPSCCILGTCGDALNCLGTPYSDRDTANPLARGPINFYSIMGRADSNSIYPRIAGPYCELRGDLSGDCKKRTN